MCCTKPVSVEKSNSDEEDDSFERIEELNHLVEADAEEEEDRFAVLEKELIAARNEIAKLTAPSMKLKFESKLWLALVFAVVVNALLHITVGAGGHSTSFIHRPVPSSPPASSPPSPSLQCEEKLCESERRNVNFHHENDGSYAFGMQLGYVTEVLPNSNAERAGLQIGDEILAINDIDVEGSVEWGIYDRICDTPHDMSDKIYRSIRGYYPEDCLGNNRWGESKTLRLVVRKNLAGFKRIQAANAKFFKLGVIASCLVAIVFLLLSALATCLHRSIDVYFTRRRWQSQVDMKIGNKVELIDDQEVETVQEEEEDDDDEDEEEEEPEVEKKLETTPMKSVDEEEDHQVPSTLDELKRLMDILDKVQADMVSKKLVEDGL